MTFLGPDTPIETLAAAADQLAPDVVVLSALTREPLAAAVDRDRQMAASRPVLVAGPGADVELAERRAPGCSPEARSRPPRRCPSSDRGAAPPAPIRPTGPLLRGPRPGRDTIAWLGGCRAEREFLRLLGRPPTPRAHRWEKAHGPLHRKHRNAASAGRDVRVPERLLHDGGVDLGVVEAERLGDAPVGEGTEFRVVADFLGRTSALTYRIVEFEPGEAVTLRGENATVVSLDRITCEPTDGGTRVTYDADLALKGPLRFADPLLGLAFKRVGDRALAGLRETLGSRRPGRLPPLSGRGLDGGHHRLPDDLRAQRTFIVAAFRREHQALVDEWLPWLIDLEERRPDVAVLELPVLYPRIRPPGGSSTAAWRAASGPTPPAPGRSRSTQTSGRPCASATAGTDTIGVLLVDRSGLILAREHGGFDDEKMLQLIAALEPSSADA